MDFSNFDIKIMQRCLELAANGLETVSPNPMVGCVIVYNQKIIGEGFHKQYGGPHAEVNAINSVKDKSLLSSSTIYVSLEPCSHYGKTPPCSDLIIESGIKEVVVASIDPNPEVAGKGLEKLKSKGINVRQGILDKEQQFLNRRFYKFHHEKKPYVLLKWAESIDAYLDRREDKETGIIQWITSPPLKSLVHKWRSQYMAILVGARTIQADKPVLNNRLWAGNSPMRIVIDRNLSLDLKDFIGNNGSPIIIFTDESKGSTEKVKYIQIKFDIPIVPQILESLYNLGIQSLMVEGGRKTLDLFLEGSYWDEINRLTGKKTFNLGTLAPKLDIQPHQQYKFANERLDIYFNNKK